MDKRLLVIYIVIVMWVSLFTTSFTFDTDLLDLTAYFSSLTGFVALYGWSETKHPSNKTNIFTKGKNSKRETITYICMVIWLFCGVFGMWKGMSITSIAAYFASLTGFVATFMVGEHNRPADKKEIVEEVKEQV